MNPLTDSSQILIGELGNFHSLVLELSALTFKVKIHTNLSSQASIVYCCKI